ncbi:MULTISPECIES: DUF6119 family protein [Gammaproteobacteria]|uniref:DUF6119 family protein n=1 Tax=Gammaproteobacteria TaxID=1236 RepID=UPI000DCF8F43|nr:MULTISPECIES: DUF6119 family protein [Gammaproteobacteria]RTE85593.1 hypothetical protein DQX04_11880 [Aliidiomarina sp. B3213]TCZ89563.1 hypothetical protein EYQ95_11810 [Lysobacter sp. N42]
MDCEIGKITLYLSKTDKSFADVIETGKLPEEDSDKFKIRRFTVAEHQCIFYCQQVNNPAHETPPWIDFINENLEYEQLLNFRPSSERPSGLLLIKKENRIYAAAFGTRGTSWLDKKKFEPDFGIKVAMNMCGNEEVRQAKSAIQSHTTQIIDRQLTKPSNSFDFGMSEIEFLRYISAHIQDDNNITLQGKDCLTIKIIGEEKLSWERLIYFLDKFVDSYGSEAYKELFPNYPNLSPVTEEIQETLDNVLIENLVNEQLDTIHLAIPDFLSDDEYSFSYSNKEKRNNYIVSHIRIEDLYQGAQAIFKTKDDITAKSIKNKKVYAYSHDEDKILANLCWSLYSCIIAEIQYESQCYILSLGEWRKVDNDFYAALNSFVINDLPEDNLAEHFNGIDISCIQSSQNREGIFNDKYCEVNPNAIKFDTAKLRIGLARKDKEFCDILELENDIARIVQVKKYGGCSSINYLFSQTRFYCEFFLTDDVFLEEIRGFIQKSGHPKSNDFLEHIKESTEDVVGANYEVQMWLLYDEKKDKPMKENLPLMAKYELKLTYERLRKTLKYKRVSVVMIPVKIVNFTKAKKNKVT